MRFVKRVQEDSKGEIMISFKPGGELYADKDIPTAIPQGAIDLAVTNSGTWSGVVPSLVAIDLAGGVYEDVQHLYKAQAGAMGQILKADLAAKDVILVGWGDSGPTNVFLSKKKLLSHPADLKGLLVRCPNNVVRWLMEAYGATPTFASVSELYTALERNTLDGAFSAMDLSKAQKLYEAAPNVTWVMTSVSAPMGVVAWKREWLSYAGATGFNFESLGGRNGVEQDRCCTEEFGCLGLLYEEPQGQDAQSDRCRAEKGMGSDRP